MSVHTRSRRRRHIGGVALVAFAAMATATSAAYASGDQAGKASTGAPTRVSGAALSALAHSAAAATAAPQILGGFTSQGWPIVVDFSKNHKQIALVETGLEMKCSSGANFPELDGWTRLPIAASGRVHISSAIPPQAGTTASLTGGHDMFTGQFNRQRTKLTGKWELSQTFSLPNGQTDQCDSGLVGFGLVV